VDHFLEWLDDWYVGIQAIDRQHLELATLFNRVAEMLRGETPTASGTSKILPLVRQLLDDTRQHFKDEEGIMREHNYPDLIDHRREHIMLLAELQAFIREIEKEQRQFDLESLTALKHWLINHVIEVDLAFARYLRQP
jgi:hemerythrin